MLARRLLPALLLCLSFSAPTLAQGWNDRRLTGRGPDAQEVFERVGPEQLLREAWEETARVFYHPQYLRDRDWTQVRERYAVEARDDASLDELHHTINAMLGELNVSHLVLLERDVFQRELLGEFNDRPTVRAACEVVDIDGRLFADGVAEGGPADLCGLVNGDEVVAIDGVPPLESGRLVDAGHDPGLPGNHGYFLRPGEANVPLVLTIRRERGGETRELSLVPAEYSLLEASRSSVRVEEVDGVQVGVVHVWHLMHRSAYRIVRDALREDFADADALVLDIRGRGGQARLIYQIIGLFTGRDPVWDRPVVVLTDRGSRSAKEIFAWEWRRQELGPIVGERTRGAVIGCTFFPLRDGSVLVAPVSDVTRLTQGESLEGEGVYPTVWVQQAPLPYRAGRDLILEAGLRQAHSLVPTASAR
jgi:carboxyl-terminal processing protease